MAGERDFFQGKTNSFRAMAISIPEVSIVLVSIGP